MQDAASALLGAQIHTDFLLLLTDAPAIYNPKMWPARKEPVPSPITPAALLKLGDFAAGSMGPKVGASGYGIEGPSDHRSGLPCADHEAADASVASERLRIHQTGGDCTVEPESKQGSPHCEGAAVHMSMSGGEICGGNRKWAPAGRSIAERTRNLAEEAAAVTSDSMCYAEGAL